MTMFTFNFSFFNMYILIKQLTKQLIKQLIKLSWLSAINKRFSYAYFQSIKQ